MALLRSHNDATSNRFEVHAYEAIIATLSTVLYEVRVGQSHVPAAYF
jgi:hypothetical protein